ncbi:3-deoxy-manno-octulosonate cytidylyltransferase [Granulicella arctica]|uniref:3-deoxy-manno-octulosonate cytidylyltransferase (CMP-KDO synthetase) n=1 Tax=Granulicella arctica TaxID=940613 RepID=A0A7Y9PK16_9BACT|nr:3-deoxy-manno-octulosonate cytidylyltransferase [Granulicella arctica]NYF81352.1 3-deoxy-manno-octulosonate cytidylyltransferase (CMP-KDO synthetase) [Granulicella arctica]
MIETHQNSSRVLGVIPARLASTRLPRKVLRQIAGRPMLAWVVEAARACPQLDNLIVATDSDEVADLCRQNNWPVQITSPDLPSGSDRVHAVAQLYPADIYVNIQGDEPLLRAEHLTALLRPFNQPHVDVTTLKVRCTEANIHNPNAVKVVTAADGRALYFSRATIPYDRDAAGATYWKHIGLYAYRKAALDRFPTLPTSTLETTERLEQLRFLENGLSLYVEPTDFDTIGVDTEADLQHVEALLLAATASSAATPTHAKKLSS